MPIDGALLGKLDTTLGEFMTKAAIDTSSHYMLEFHNDIDQRWLKNFGNYSQSGESFDPMGGWTNWIEALASKETCQIQVLMNPPKALMRGRRASMDNQVRLEYMHDIEPRKLAHQLLTIRESVTAEMIADLACVKTENVEAMRYAHDKLEQGAEKAEKERRLTRMPESDSSESTPLRDRSYLEVDIIVTNFALEHVRMELAKQRDELGIVFLDDVLKELQNTDEKRTVLERLLSEFAAPREFIESVCVKGLELGVDRSTGLNALKIAERLLLARWAFALEANRILVEHDRHCRSYYKLIRDKGGFQTWSSRSGMQGRAKVRVVDLQVEEKLEAEAAVAAREAEADAAARAAAEAEAQAQAQEAARRQRELEVAAELERAAAAAEAGPDEESFGSFGSGPVMM